jgi:glutamate dehydrogenase
MSYKFEQGKDLIIDSIVEKVSKKMAAKKAERCGTFLSQFYQTVALDDLEAWNVDDLYGAGINLWNLLSKRKPGETKIRIYNPDFERHGWQTTHTVVEIIADDMPFLVDSIRMVINRMGLSCHLIMHMGGLMLKRDKHGHVTKVYKKIDVPHDEVFEEAAIFIEIDSQTDPIVLRDLHEDFERVLEDNKAVVEDWVSMREKVQESIIDLEKTAHLLDAGELSETIAFLNWIEDHHFTFLGIRDYELVKEDKSMILKVIPNTGLGVLRHSLSQSKARIISEMTPEARELTLSSTRILVMSKTNTLASVHRDAYTDYIGIKRFDKTGKVIGERRIIGLYTSAAYNTNPKHIPFLRHKVAQIMEKSQLNPRSHSGKVLLNILETLPRDDLIQATEDELLEISMGIFYMQERRRIRMFARTDVYRRFISCLVYVPRERFNTALRHAMEMVLEAEFDALEISFSTHFSASVLARIHFIIRIDPTNLKEYDFKDVEKKLIIVGRSWSDDLHDYLKDSFGEEKANRLNNEYKDAFPVAYSTQFSPRTAVFDIIHIEALSEQEPLGMNFFHPMDEDKDFFRLKVYQHESTITISDVLPILERLGMRAISERPYFIKHGDGFKTWINDFSLQYIKKRDFDIDVIKDLFQNAFLSVWYGHAENDGFNLLVLGAGLDWRQVSILRAYAKYFKQIRFTFSQEYIENALNNNVAIARKLVQLFEVRFNPDLSKDRDDRSNQLVREILNDLDDVSNLDEDKIIRQYVQTITSTLRTNYYQINASGKPAPYLSLKMNSKTIAGMPKPYPMYEIFVYSPRFEGVHLRGGKVARGGLRWSDRREDFRTEILGLMKAQQVKNAVIVPSGAKGGFVPKLIASNASREEIMEEGISCYQLFIHGLLDLTDNLVEGKIVKPARVVCFDEDDPYLVVAADKGTATFSDIANEISLDYGFWLGDAFASGGSVGYDHKKMGITAKGAWESVKRHFYEMNIDIQTKNFSVVGIGDMAGDVFGNGMLLSKQVQLVAAFNHVHIFIDPNPDSQASFKERERLFHLPRSSWTDYDKKLISKGGGVFNRSAKSIPVTKEMKNRFGIKQSVIEPNELIQYLLKAKVDLLWSGGIGTFVRASTETNADVGDRSNDAIRIEANQLRAKVIGEGGNLGLTQAARIEYSLNGGLVFTDFIDNSAGVNCSDREVNIKILLNSIVDSGDLTTKQRNELLSDMTDEVSRLVLRDNYNKSKAIGLAAAQAHKSIDLHARYIQDLESRGKIDRVLEYLPDDKVLNERKLSGQGLMRPSLSVLMCYSKILLKANILSSNVPDDPYLKQILDQYFPRPLREKFSTQMNHHPLRREIIATQLSNIIINEMGFTFVYRLQDETGAPVSAIVRAYMISRSILNIDEIWRKIDELGTKITAETQIKMMLQYVRLCRRTTRWFLRSQRKTLDISSAIERYKSGVNQLKKCMPQIFAEKSKELYQSAYDHYLSLNVGNVIAHELAVTRALFSAMDIIEVSQQMNIKVTKVAQVYFALGEYLDLNWIRTKVIVHSTENHWELLSREALRDDLDWQQRQLTAGIIRIDMEEKDLMDQFNQWFEMHKNLIDRWHNILAELKSAQTMNYTMFFVAIRELLDLTQTTIQMADKQVMA